MPKPHEMWRERMTSRQLYVVAWWARWAIAYLQFRVKGEAPLPPRWREIWETADVIKRFCEGCGLNDWPSHDYCISILTQTPPNDFPDWGVDFVIEVAFDAIDIKKKKPTGNWGPLDLWRVCRAAIFAIVARYVLLEKNGLFLPPSVLRFNRNILAHPQTEEAELLSLFASEMQDVDR